LAAYAWRLRGTRGSQMFSLFMAALTIYVLGYSMELATLDLHTMLFWSKFEYLGIYSFPTLFLLFVFQYTDRQKWITRRNILLLFIFPTLLLICKYTDDTFHLVYSTAWVDTSGIIPLLGFTRGPAYPLALYSCIPVILGIILLWRKRQNTSPLYRKQATLMASIAMIPLVVFILYMAGFQPFPGLKYLDWNAFAYNTWGLGIAWAMLRYRLLDLAPVARDALIEHLNDGVFVLDSQARLVDANPMALKILGWTQAPIGENVSMAFSAWDELRNACGTNVSAEPVKAEIHLDKAGQSIFYDLTDSPLQDDLGRNIGRLIVVHDVTERKQFEEELRELSLVDELTGLSNRRGFFVLAGQLIQMAKRMSLRAAVIFIDMDGLKLINDHYGHAQGDTALIETAAVLRYTVRASDICARLGGDEFIILALETHDNSTDMILERMHEHLETLNRQNKHQYLISVSYGVAHFLMEQPASLEDLIQEADKAMYAQKNAKKCGGYPNTNVSAITNQTPLMPESILSGRSQR